MTSIFSPDLNKTRRKEFIGIRRFEGTINKTLHEARGVLMRHRLSYPALLPIPDLRLTPILTSFLDPGLKQAHGR